MDRWRTLCLQTRYTILNHASLRTEEVEVVPSLCRLGEFCGAIFFQTISIYILRYISIHVHLCIYMPAPHPTDARYSADALHYYVEELI